MYGIRHLLFRKKINVRYVTCFSENNLRFTDCELSFAYVPIIIFVLTRNKKYSYFILTRFLTLFLFYAKNNIFLDRMQKMVQILLSFRVTRTVDFYFYEKRLGEKKRPKSSFAIISAPALIQSSPHAFFSSFLRNILQYLVPRDFKIKYHP